MNAKPYTYYPVKQTGAEWHSLRAGRLTASLAAACCGASPWMSPQEAYRTITDPAHVHVSNWYMEHGREMEPTAVSVYETQTGRLTRDCGFFLSAERPWLGASPDRLVGKDGLLEVKCGQRVYAEPAPSWLIQCTVQLYCTGRAWCDLCHYYDGEISLWRVNRTLESEVLLRLDHYHQTFLLPSRCPARRELPRWSIPRPALDGSYVRSAIASQSGAEPSPE